MTFNIINSGDPGLASVAMQNWRHVNYGNDLIPVNSSGSGVNNTINCGSTSFRWTGVYSVLGNFSGAVTMTSTLNLSGNLTVDTDTLYVDAASDEVGVNINPARSFHVYGASSAIGDSRSNVFIEDSASYAQGVGGGISFLGKYSAGGSSTALGGIWAEKENANDGDFDGQLHLGARRDGGTISSDLVIDSSGNVGIGNSSLESWSTTYTAMQLGGNGFIMASTAAGASKVMYIGQNAYFDSVDSRWEYINTDEASSIEMSGGNHYFYNAVSGTEDTAINWTTSMFISSIGQVGIGTTGPDRKLDVLDASNPQQRWTHTDGSVYSEVQTNASGNTIFTNTGGTMAFQETSSSATFQIDSDNHGSNAILKLTAESAGGVDFTSTMTLDPDADTTTFGYQGTLVANSTSSGDNTFQIDSNSHGANAILSFTAESAGGTDKSASILLDPDNDVLEITGDTFLDLKGPVTRAQSRFAFGDNSEVTISSLGTITATSSNHEVDTYLDASTDDLNSITVGAEGQILILRAISDSRTVVVKHGTGNIKLDGGTDFSLDSIYDTITLTAIGGFWCEISRSNNGT